MADYISHTVEITAIDSSNYFWDTVGGDKILLPFEICYHQSLVTSL